MALLVALSSCGTVDGFVALALVVALALGIAPAVAGPMHIRSGASISDQLVEHDVGRAAFFAYVTGSGGVSVALEVVLDVSLRRIVTRKTHR